MAERDGGLDARSAVRSIQHHLGLSNSLRIALRSIERLLNFEQSRNECQPQRLNRDHEQRPPLKSAQHQLTFCSWMGLSGGFCGSQSTREPTLFMESSRSQSPACGHLAIPCGLVPQSEHRSRLNAAAGALIGGPSCAQLLREDYAANVGAMGHRASFGVLQQFPLVSAHFDFHARDPCVVRNCPSASVSPSKPRMQY